MFERLDAWVGKKVVVESTFPVPIGGNQVAFIPTQGSLKAVYEDGVELEDKDGGQMVLPFVTLRSVILMKQSDLVVPKKNGLVGI